MATSNVTINITAKITVPHRLKVGLGACSRAIESTDRAAAAHDRGDDRMAEFWLSVREHWRYVAARNSAPAAALRGIGPRRTP